MGVQSDDELMCGVKEGDHDAFRALLDRYWTALHVFATSIVGTSALAEDLVQEGFTRVWQHRTQWNSDGSARGYLYRIVRNLALNQRRRHKVEAHWHETVRGGGEVPPAPPTPEEIALGEDLRREVDAAIESLPTRRRQVFILSRFHGLSHQEISVTMGIAPQTVSNQMKMALDHLRDRLHRYLE